MSEGEGSADYQGEAAAGHTADRQQTRREGSYSEMNNAISVGRLGVAADTQESPHRQTQAKDLQNITTDSDLGS